MAWWSSVMGTFRRLLREEASGGTDARLAPGLVRFGDLRRLVPISSGWGFDRGEPIDRYYIDDFLALHVDDIRGRVLEFADSSYANRFGADRVQSVEIAHHTAANSRATLITDLTKAGALPAAAFDCIILTQVLQYVSDL